MIEEIQNLFVSINAIDPILFYAVGFSAVLVTAISKAGFGGAIPIGVPLLLLVTTPRVALGITLPILLVIDVWVVVSYRKDISLRLLGIISLFGLLGHFIAWNVFDYISNQILTIFICGISFLTVITFFRNFYFRTKSGSEKIMSLRSPSVWPRSFFWGTLSGISSFISTTGGIPLNIFLLSFKLDRRLHLGTAAAFFFLLNLTKIPMYASLGVISPEILKVSVLLMPAIPVGLILGLVINSLLDDKQFHILMHILLGITGCKLLFDLLT